MTDNIVLWDERNGVAYITLNRPDVHNAFDETMIARLSEIWDRLAVRDDLFAVVLRGNGKNFSAGADAAWMKRAAAQPESQNYEDTLKLAVMLGRLYELPQMTIACIHGAAFGGGLGLVSCCDMAIASNDSLFSLSEVRLGLIPATIGPYVIRAIGKRQAGRYFQSGERFSAARAYEMGLVGELAADIEDMEKRLSGLIDGLRQNGRQAMRAAKILCRDVAAMPLNDALKQETARRIATIRAGEEAREGLSAFLEKRKPAWTDKKAPSL